jgi:hypothetical protein
MKRSWLICLVYCALTVALTYPLIRQLGSVLPNDAGDPALNTWILWWNAQALPYTTTWWNAPAFYPIPGALTFSEHLLGLSLIATPIQWLGGGPQLAYNVVFLLTFPLSAMGAYVLALEITKRHDAAFIAGLLFGFSPYRIAHLPHVQALASFAMPFAVLGLHRYLRDSRPRWLVLFGAGWFLQAICNGYYLLFFSVFVGMWILWFASPWSRPQMFRPIVAAWAVASLPLIPILWRYQVVHRGFGFTREFGTIGNFGADIAGLLYAAPALEYWGWLNVYRRAEGELFPGLTIALLVTAGAIVAGGGTPTRGRTWGIVRGVLAFLAAITALVSLSAIVIGPWHFDVSGVRLLSVTNPIKPLTSSILLGIGLALTSPRLRQAYSTRSVLGFYAVGAFMMWLFSLGPTPSLMGQPFMYRGPYALLMLLPGFSSLRVPARFWMMTTLCLAVIGAILFDRLTARLGRTRVIAAGIVCLGILADGWVGEFPLARAPERWKAESCGGAGADRALMELPLGDAYRDLAAMYRSMSHGRPVVNGYSGYFPPHYAALRFGLAGRDANVLTQLASHGAGYIVVNAHDDADGRWRTFVSAHEGVEVVCTEGPQTLYRIEGVPAAEPAVSGEPLPVAVLRPNVNSGAAGMMMDGDRTTRWESGPQTDRTAVEIDLGALRTVSALELMLGPFVEDFPRALAIEASEDGKTWRELWRGSSAGLAFAGAFEAPRDVPLRYELPRTPARYLRLRLLANDETYYWSVAELKVLGS